MIRSKAIVSPIIGTQRGISVFGWGWETEDLGLLVFIHAKTQRRILLRLRWEYPLYCVNRNKSIRKGYTLRYATLIFKAWA